MMTRQKFIIKNSRITSKMRNKTVGGNRMSFSPRDVCDTPREQNPKRLNTEIQIVQINHDMFKRDDRPLKGKYSFFPWPLNPKLNDDIKWNWKLF